MVEVPPGRYVVSTQTDESFATAAVEAVAGETYFLEQRTRLGVVVARVSLRAIVAAEGRNAIRGFSRVLGSFEAGSSETESPPASSGFAR
jgi:hypothetical protein